MEVLFYFLAALSLSVLYNPQPANGQGVFLELTDTLVSNFGLLAHSDIGTSHDVDDVGSILVCRTDNTSCCRAGDNPNGRGFGSWYHPDGSLVPFPYAVLQSGGIYKMQRGTQVVRLIRDSSASITTGHNGIYRCEVANQNGVIQTRYVGLFTDGTGVVSISQPPQFSLISENPLEFTLTSTTTGGPPTTAFWIPPHGGLVDDTLQTLLDGVTGIVEHKLTVIIIGSFLGNYTFYTTNSRSGPPVSRSITVEATNPPTGLMAVQNGLTSILVSWTAPASGGAIVTGYRISYQTGGGSEQSVDVGAAATNHILTGLLGGETYNISIVALSDQFPSTAVGLVVTTVVPVPPIVTTDVLGPTSIRVTFTQPITSLPAESYNIQYTRVTGAGQTLCDSVEDTGTTTDVQSPFTITSLEEFSNYSIAVTVLISGTFCTATKQAMTFIAAPSGIVWEIWSTAVLSTSITVGWTQVRCIERNGVIDSYIVRFGPEGGVQNENTVQSGGVGVPRTFTASGLTPFTRYSFDVAAVNSAGTGPFTHSAPITVQTTEAAPGPVESVVLFGDTVAITLAWNQPQVPNGIIRRYEIVYSDGASTNMVTATHGVRDRLDAYAYSFFRRRQTSKVLVGLKPDTTYNITITPRNTYLGVPTSVAGKTLYIPKVSGVEVSAVNSTAVEVSWVAVDLIHATGLRYKLYYEVSSSHYTEDFTLEINSGQTSAVVDIQLLTVADLEHQFSVAAVYEVEGEVFEGEKSDIATMLYNETYFQLWLTPVDNCATWDSDKVDYMRYELHAGIARAISEQCACNFPVKHIREGAFRCWNSAAAEVTYRASLIGTRTHTAGELVGHLDSYVNSTRAVLKMDGVELKLLNGCPVHISGPYDQECPEEN